MFFQDLPATVRRVADFYGKTLSEEQIDKLAQHLHFDNFKKNKTVNMEDMKEAGVFRSDGDFIRKGEYSTFIIVTMIYHFGIYLLVISFNNL